MDQGHQMSATKQDGRFAEFLAETLKYPALCEGLLRAIDIALPETATRQERNSNAWDEFDFLVERVAHDMRQHALRRELILLFRDESLMVDEQAISVFNFIYSSLVNHFKGQLAELLSGPILRQFASALVIGGRVRELPEIQAGHEISTARIHKQSRTQWKSGPDAILVVRGNGPRTNYFDNHPPGDHGDALVIAAVAEIKSYRETLKKVRAQLDQHISMIQNGVRIGAATKEAKNIQFVMSGKRTEFTLLQSGEGLDPTQVAKIYIRTKLANKGPEPLSEGAENFWTAELDFTKDDLMDAGFHLADWFLGRIGADVFSDLNLSHLDLSPDERIKNPWPEMTPEQAGRNAILERMYYLGMRDIFNPKSPRSLGFERARQTFHWLYNSLGFGYENASGVEMQFPEADEVSSATQIDSAAPTAPAANPRWQRAMAAYRSADFATALTDFPESGGKPQKLDFWWPRNVAMLARLMARNGNSARADAILGQLEPFTEWPYPALSVEAHAVAALSRLADNDLRGAKRAVEASLTSLNDIRRDRDERERRKQGQHPWLDIWTIHMAMLDIVAVLAALGEFELAAQELTKLHNVDTWVKRYISSDPLLKPLLENAGTKAMLNEWLNEGCIE